MYSLDKIKKEIIKKINKALGKELIQASDLIYPPSCAYSASEDKLDSKMGDISLPCFKLAKQLNKTPVEVAELLETRFPKNLKNRDRVSEIPETRSLSSIFVCAVGPYLNFNINKEYLAQNVIKEINNLKNNYGSPCWMLAQWDSKHPTGLAILQGQNKSGKEKKIMIEYSNANTHKEYHVGHLRNICYGDAVNKILSANGYQVIAVSYINDFGIHTAKTLWNYEKYNANMRMHANNTNNANKIFNSLSKEEKGVILGKIYVDACKKAENNKIAKSEITLMMKKIETRKGAEYELWKKTRNWSIIYFDKIYGELRIKFKKIFYESEFIDNGLKLVDELLENKILKKSKNAIIADLEKYNLGVLVCMRSDKTALYPIADISLGIEKFQKYKLDKSIYVVDNRQSLYFKQLFKVLELMNCKKEMLHLGYEFVKLPSGTMSSRSGNVITYEELKQQILEKAKKETQKRHFDWDEKKIKNIAEKIGFGAIKFEMIKVNANQIITFNIEKALQFDGYTSAYLQYANARINSIFRMSDVGCRMSDFNCEKLIEIKEHGLIIKLAKYPEIILKAGENYDPSEIAKYLFELARLFNDYYHSIPVLKADIETRNARLALLSGVSQVIKNGLGLLGIEVMEEM